MRKQIFILILLAATEHCLLFSQAPEIEWQKSYGGSIFDSGVGIKQTSDKGYIIAGSTFSHDGDVTGLHGSEYDSWPLKLDSAGNLEWQNTLGGSYGDYGSDVYLTADGGFILLGFAGSNDGDVTGHHGLLGTPDIWLVKINSLGHKIWQKCLGGNGGETPGDLVFTADGGYLIAGRTHSVNTGDVVGGHSIFSDDVWLIKTNSTGSIVWQKVYGGTEDEIAESIIPAIGSGYVVLGQANSTDFDVTGNHGENDVWLLKLNNTGDLLWEKSLGGTKDDVGFIIRQTIDNNYIIAASSMSNDGDISGHHGIATKSDIWVAKIDTTGNIIWQNSFGGSENENPTQLHVESDGSFIITGSTYSNDGDVSVHYGTTAESDYWMFKLDFAGNFIWQKSYGGSDFDSSWGSASNDDGSFTLCGNSSSDDVDVSLNQGYNDIWIVKLLPECIATPEVCNALDDNCNGVIDDGITETISISAGGPIIFCQGGSVLLTATYSGTSVQWKKNGTNIAGATSSTYSVNKTGDYTCVTTSPCGTATSSLIHVIVNKNPAASITAGGATTFCAGGSVTLTEAAVAGSTYQWYKGASAIAGATSTNYIATTAGNYKCRVTKTASGCFKNSNTITVTVPCREGEDLVNENDPQDAAQNSFSIYPNPNNGTFTINALWPLCALCETNNTLMEVYNPLGQLIYSQNLNSSTGNINETISIPEDAAHNNLS
ncbi:MAG: hypothetical protein ACHQFW_12100, partial [Chitinophagales bacterium]